LYLRERKSLGGNDFIARLMEMRKAKRENPNVEGMKSLSDDMIMAQVWN